MAIPSDKQTLLEAIKVNFAALRKELANIPEENASIKNMEGHAKGSVMSVKDLVSYLIGWGQLVLKWNNKQERGELIDFPETGYKWNELGQLAQKFYRDQEHDSYANVLVMMEKTVNQLVQLVENKTNAQLYGTPWYTNYTLGRMVQLNTSSPYKNAALRIRKWKKSKKTSS
jgi:hypothetical protein